MNDVETFKLYFIAVFNKSAKINNFEVKAQR